MPLVAQENHAIAVPSSTGAGPRSIAQYLRQPTSGRCDFGLTVCEEWTCCRATRTGLGLRRCQTVNRSDERLEIHRKGEDLVPIQ